MHNVICAMDPSASWIVDGKWLKEDKLEERIDQRLFRNDEKVIQRALEGSTKECNEKGTSLTGISGHIENPNTYHLSEWNSERHIIFQ
jgi:hypothetical protein